jgi:hypothetical protein
MKVLITRPRHEDTTNYLFHYSGEVVDEARRKGRDVFDLQKQRATRQNVQGYLKKVNPELVIFNGHGSADAIGGHDDEVIVSNSDGSELLKEKIVYARACKCARSLGPLAVKNGAKAFIGYNEDFLFPSQDMANPFHDDSARDCLECSNAVALGLVRNKSPQDAHMDSVKMFKERIARLQTSNAAYASTSVACLLWNLSAQVVLIP